MGPADGRIRLERDTSELSLEHIECSACYTRWIGSGDGGGEGEEEGEECEVDRRTT